MVFVQFHLVKLRRLSNFVGLATLVAANNLKALYYEIKGPL